MIRRGCDVRKRNFNAIGIAARLADFLDEFRDEIGVGRRIEY